MNDEDTLPSFCGCLFSLFFLRVLIDSHSVSSFSAYPTFLQVRRKNTQLCATINMLARAIDKPYPLPNIQKVSVMKIGTRYRTAGSSLAVTSFSVAFDSSQEPSHSTDDSHPDRKRRRTVPLDEFLFCQPMESGNGFTYTLSSMFQERDNTC